MTRSVPSSGPVRIALGAPGRAGVEPVVAPLPHVAGDVVQAEASAGKRRPARCPRSRRPPCSRSGNGPGRRSSGARRPARAHRPRGMCPAEPAARRVLPLRLGRQARARPRAVGLRIRPRHVHDRVMPYAPSIVGLRSFGMAPVGAVRPAATTAPHATARVAGKSSGSRPPNTNEPAEPLGFGHVSGGSTKAANASFVTA